MEENVLYLNKKLRVEALEVLWADTTKLFRNVDPGSYRCKIEHCMAYILPAIATRHTPFLRNIKLALPFPDCFVLFGLSLN